MKTRALFSVFLMGSCFLTSNIAIAYDEELDAIPVFAPGDFHEVKNSGDSSYVDLFSEDYSSILPSESEEANSSDNMVSQRVTDQTNFAELGFCAEDYSPLL
ncbi:hypothetical protein [Thiomicrorhabdus sp.]|uniref:hypothetical protein n=1 Tax=Thiomicrorhabdus sp. TaxID=2039724 RepID=UPI0029C715E1|nr:hypothetical protein [Thiomicrorhabdus sp.]